ncbi:DUF2243 domain-containing protein [Nonomuraea fuscirosea]|uniref:DUF2243 domain-containing protein n=1 Tax=Nonomuraea fuscirosea TaxID=1291556 RepID=UPI0034462A34
MAVAARTGVELPGTILGVGLGGFVDGILLHQVLPWHHMLSSTGADNIGVRPYLVDTVPGLRMNTLWDGLFPTFTWLAVLIGLGLLYSRVTGSRGQVWRSRSLWGWILVSWGLFGAPMTLLLRALPAAGPDPAPRRPSVPTRLVVLGVAVAVHAGLSQLMYAGIGVAYRHRESRACRWANGVAGGHGS